MLARPSSLVHAVIGCCIEVHRALGPGLLESMYGRCVRHELTLQQIPFESEVPIAVDYKGLVVDRAYRADLIVGGWLLVELKSVEAVLPIHRAQALTYMKLLKLEQGMLINFNVSRLVDGIHNLLLDRRAPPAA